MVLTSPLLSFAGGRGEEEARLLLSGWELAKEPEVPLLGGPSDFIDFYHIPHQPLAVEDRPRWASLVLCDSSPFIMALSATATAIHDGTGLPGYLRIVTSMQSQLLSHLCQASPRESLPPFHRWAN